jgi:hypothetical protein
MSGAAMLLRQRQRIVGVPPVVPGAWAPNLPSGLTLYGDTFFGDIINGSITNAAGWRIDGTQSGVGVGELRTDYNQVEAGAPYSEDVFKYTYPEGSLGGGTGIVTLNTPDVDWQRHYVCISFKLSDNYLMHSNEEKFWFPVTNNTMGGQPASNFNIRRGSSGSATTNFAFRMNTQSGVGSQSFGDTTTPVSRGQWHMIEIFMQMNTPSATDGIFRFWIDGELMFEKTSDVNYSGTFATPRFARMRLDSTRGGGNSTDPVPTGGMSRSFSRMTLYSSSTLP